MAAGARVLSSSLIRWLEGRLLLAKTTETPLPSWPPDPLTIEALLEGREADALVMPDALGRRYVVQSSLRRDVPHLFIARDEVLERDVVLKLVIAPSEQAREAALREARFAATIEHPNIVHVHEIDDEGRYIVLERLDGDMRDHDSLSIELLVDAFCQAGRGLAAAHARNIYHRDLRPENILVRLGRDESGEPVRVWAKLTDFGQGVDATGQRAGWAAEDQRDFAMAFWECLSGGLRAPRGKELIPAQLHAVLSKALMPQASQRWADMTALVDAIERGRGATAASSGQTSEVSAVFSRALVCAEDGMFGHALIHWKELCGLLSDEDAELGQRGVSLGAALFSAARARVGAVRRGGLQRAFDVLEQSMRRALLGGDSDTHDQARSLAAETCDEWKQTYSPDTSEYLQLIALAESLRRD